MEYREYAEYQEYMTSLQEQIHDRRAKQSVEREIGGHIEAQCAACEASGMPREQAVAEAVRQMGSPVEVGAELNKIHRPKTPVGMLFLVAALMVMGLVMQSHIFWQLKFMFKDTYLYRSIFYNIIGFGVICIMLFMDYNFLGRYASRIYAGLFTAILLFGLLGESFQIGRAQWLSIRYYLPGFLPLVLAGLVYQNRGKGARGMVRCLLLMAAICGVTLLILENFSGMVEGAGICILLMCIVLWKDIFHIGQRRSRLLLGGLCALGVAAGVIFVIRLCSVPIEDVTTFKMARLMAFINPAAMADSTGYSVLRQRGAMAGYHLLGGRTLPFEADSSQASTYIISSLLSWYGVAAGIVVVGAMLAFGIYGLRISLKQSNRLGMLLGSVCSISLLYRTCMAVLINLGWFVEYTMSVPFLGFGLAGTLFNSVMIGIILCVYRNERILCELPDDRDKARWRLKLQWVKE